MRLICTCIALCLLSLPASAQEKFKEVGPIKEIPLKVTDLKKPLDYLEHVDALFAKRCTVCHSGNIKEGKLDLGSYETLMRGGKSGDVVKPGKSQDSILYKAVQRTHRRPMPPKGDEPCTQEEVALIKLWIDDGAKAPKNIKPPKEIFVTPPPSNVNPVRAVAVSPDKNIVAGARGNQIHIYDAGSGAHVRTLVSPGLKTKEGKDVKAAHISLVESMCWSPDGKYLVSGSFREITIWEAATGEERHKIKGFAHIVVAMTFSPDGKFLGVAGGSPTADGEVKIFDVGTWALKLDLKNCHSDTVYGLSFSPELQVPAPGEKLPDPNAKNPPKIKTVPAYMLATCSADKFVKVWNLPDGKAVKSFEGHTHHVLDVGWASDGKLLASAGADNTVKIWDFEKGEQARTINAHGKQVTRLMFIGKKAEFLTCGGDNAVKKFNATNGGNTGNYAGGTDFIYAIGTSPDGAVIVAGGQDGIVRVYNGTNSQLTRSLLPPDAQPPMKQEEKKK
ncbi:MAG: NB-ARC domain protein [Planctomycetes bacterium]|nr:NB-ARC domain protein [Planctomycetota bacterium]